MSTHAVGTIAVRQIPDLIDIEYIYEPAEGKEDFPWLALDAPPILAMLMGDEDGEIRFTDEDIAGKIATGDLTIK